MPLKGLENVLGLIDVYGNRTVTFSNWEILIMNAFTGSVVLFCVVKAERENRNYNLFKKRNRSAILRHLLKLCTCENTPVPA
jgi:hypothetical protein